MDQDIYHEARPGGSIGPIALGPGKPMVLVAGPCVIESAQHCIDLAGSIKQITDKLNIPYIFKASFDKANRSSGTSFRGPGLEKGLEILQAVKQKLDLPVISDIHLPSQATAAAQVLDVIQIPAFLARQTDLLIAAGKTGKTINIKKGQFMAPWEMGNAAAKAIEAGAGSVVLTERGTFFGYNRLINDMRSIQWMHRLGFPVLFDATHSTAEPGGAGNQSGGQRELAPLLARAAVAAGADGLFLEVHDNPEKAKSDAATVMPIDHLEKLLQTCLKIYSAVSTP